VNTQDEISITVWDEVDLLEERAGAIGRASERLGRILAEMNELAQELDRMELTIYIPGISTEMCQEIQTEIDVSVDAYNHLREAAAYAYRQLILLRESCGFRGHELVQRCYPIPDLRFPTTYLDCLEQ